MGKLKEKLLDLLMDGPKKIDQVWIDGKEVKVISGDFKATHLATDNLAVLATCTYKREGENSHTLECLLAEGYDNNYLKIDGNPMDLTKVKIEPDPNLHWTRATLEAEEDIVFMDKGHIRTIKISSQVLAKFNTLTLLHLMAA